MSDLCPICNRPLCRTTLGDSSDYEQRAKCWKIGYERLQNRLAADFANACAVGRKLEAENIGLRESLRSYYDVLRENDTLRDLLRRSLDVISPYDTTLWPEIHRAVHPAPSTKP